MSVKLLIEHRLEFLLLNVLWIFKNIFETLHDLNDSAEKPILKFQPSQKLCKF